MRPQTHWVYEKLVKLLQVNKSPARQEVSPNKNQQKLEQLKLNYAPASVQNFPSEF